jgi:putative MATE family efflux protein|tara:strand:+ start:1062 stop:2450 length:1389 start_codon:yes stop_codon:yes gene_type:complete
LDYKPNSESRLSSFLADPSKALWRLAVPIMFGMGIHTLYNVIDMIFIGKLGGNAIAGVAFNMPIFFLMLGLTMGLGSGVTASIARFIGDEDKKSADNSAEHALAMAGGIAIVFTILGIYYGEKILIALGAEGEILILAWEYLSMIVLGLPFMVFSGFFRSILAGEGDMKFPMMVAGLGTLLNTILDPIFIFKLEDYGNIGFGMGVKGAAMATVFSQLIVFLIFIYMLFIKDHAYITFKLKDFMPSKIILWDIIKVGLPASLSMIIMALGQGVFNKILIYYSSQTVAAYQVAGRLDMLIFLPIFAIAGALTTLVGMFYGAREIGALNRIVRYGISSAFLITLVSSSFVYIFAETFSSWFTQDQEIISVSVGFLKRLCLVYPLVAIAITSGRVMQGLGKGLPVLLITIIRVLGVSAPLGLYFSFVLEKPVEWNWYAMMIAAFISFLIAIFWVRIELTKINRGQT